MQKRRTAGPSTIVVKFTGSTGSASAAVPATTQSTGRRTSGPGTIVVKFTGNNA